MYLNRVTTASCAVILSAAAFHERTPAESLTVAVDSLDTALVRAAVARSLPLLQSSADTWFEKRSCASCHHQGLGLMTATVARERGFSVDTTRIGWQASRTLRRSVDWPQEYVTSEISINEAIGQSYRAVGAGTAGYPASPVTDAISHLIAGRQQPSGRWPSYSRRPPLEDSEFTATALSIRTLALFPIASRRQEFSLRIARARKWLRTAVAESTEDQNMQLLGLAWSGERIAATDSLVKLLMRAQRADGGWGQTQTRESDSYATGQALVALNQAAHIPMRDARMQKGLEFLLRTQIPDGSWHVPTRRTAAAGLAYFESGYPHGKDQFISYAGAAWATMALALTRNDAVSPALMGKPRAIAIVAAGDTGTRRPITPLMQAALFGTTQDVARLIKAGASVNDSTNLGLTALMFAAYDAAKVKLLLDAGANVNARASAGHTALNLASAYGGSFASVTSLLERGAMPDRSVAFSNFPGATPLAQAVARGDTAVATLLLARGAKIDGLPGVISTPLRMAVVQGDAAMVRWLLKNGALPNGVPSADGSYSSTPLMTAAREGRAAVVRALIDGGATIDLVDRDRRSALHFVAEAPERGNTDIIDMLLRGGADPLRESKTNETPLSLAQKYGNAMSAARLTMR